MSEPLVSDEEIIDLWGSHGAAVLDGSDRPVLDYSDQLISLVRRRLAERLDRAIAERKAPPSAYQEGVRDGLNKAARLVESDGVEKGGGADEPE